MMPLNHVEYDIVYKCSVAWGIDSPVGGLAAGGAQLAPDTQGRDCRGVSQELTLGCSFLNWYFMQAQEKREL
jgi:hypothetical protein